MWVLRVVLRAVVVVRQVQRLCSGLQAVRQRLGSVDDARARRVRRGGSGLLGQRNKAVGLSQRWLRDTAVWQRMLAHATAATARWMGELIQYAARLCCSLYQKRSSDLTRGEDIVLGKRTVMPEPPG